MKPWCVEACPAGARIFGDISKPSSRVFKLVQQYTPKQLLRTKGTKAKVFYIFIGPFHVIAPPYSSVFLDEQACVMGDSTRAAIDFYVQGAGRP